MTLDLRALFLRWLDLLADLAVRLRGAGGAGALAIELAGARCVIRASAAPEAATLCDTPLGAAPPEEIRQHARSAGAQLLWPQERSVLRTLALPVQARDFAAGVVRNQIDRLSPWPAAQTLFGFAEDPQSGADAFTARVYIAERAEVEAARAALANMALRIDKVVVADAPQVALWAAAAPERHSRGPARSIVGGALCAYAALCGGVAVWTFDAAAELQAESDALAARLQRAQKPGASGGGAPAERAWTAKTTAPSAVQALEAAARALPDGAYLSDLHLESDRLRLAGLADDAPPLVAALERSGDFLDAHFSAPTTRGGDGPLSRFAVEARLAPKTLAADEAPHAP
jgi:general secretion pathway protein L